MQRNSYDHILSFWTRFVKTCLISLFLVSFGMFLTTPLHAQTVTFSGAQSAIASFPAGSLSPIAVDAAGDIFAVENDGTTSSLIKVDASGGQTVLYSNFPFSPQAIAVNSAGTILYFIHTGPNWNLPYGGVNWEYVTKMMITGGVAEAPTELPRTFTFAGISGWTGAYSTPMDMKVDSSGNVYIADNGGMLWRIPSGGTVPTAFLSPTVGQPYEIAISPDGYVYFTYVDFTNANKNTLGRVSALAFGTSFSGTAQTSINSSLTSVQSGLAVDSSGNILVGGSDSVVYRVSGGTLTPVSPPSPNGLSGFGVDSTGKIYTSGGGGAGGSAISTTSFNSAGFGSQSIGSTTAVLPLQFSFGTGGKLGSISVLTQGASGLDFANAGSGTCNTTTMFAAGDTCTVDVTFTPAYAGLRQGAVVLKNTTGDILSTVLVYGTGTGPQIAFSPALQSVIASGLSSAAGVAVDAAGNVYIADAYNAQVLKETLSGGSYAQSVVADGTNGLVSPYGVAVDGAGSVYIADVSTSHVLKETLSGGSYAQSVVADQATNGLNHPYGVAVDGAGNVYIADAFNHRVLKETPSGSSYVQSVVADQATNGLDIPYSVAVDAAGSVYIGDAATNHRVLKETPSGSSYVQSVVADQANMPALDMPAGLAVDAAGSVYIADTTGGQVSKATLSGGSYTLSVVADSYSTSGLTPWGVAVEGDGNVYIGNYKTVLKEDYAHAPALSFATTRVGTPSYDSPKAITVTNIGNHPLDFWVPTVDFNPTIGADFTLDGTSSCQQLSPSSPETFTLLVGGFCTYDIGFNPTTSGPLSESLVMTDNAQPGTQTIALSGTGRPAPPVISMAFGAASIPINNTVSLTFTIQNNNTVPIDASFTDSLPYGLVTAIPTGAVNNCGGTVSNSLPLPATSLSFSNPALPVGACTITVNVQSAVNGVYNNSITINSTDAGNGNTSFASLTVLADTTAAVTSSQNPAVFGQSVTFTATVAPVAPGTGTPSGTVTFLDGGSPIGTGTLNGGVATFTTSVLAVGNHTITTSYVGEGSFNGSTGSLTGNPQVVNQATTTTTVNSSPNPSVFGSSVTFTATVMHWPEGPGTVTGTVTFAVDGTTIGTGTLSGGVATYTTSNLGVSDDHGIVAIYAGDANFTGSTSATWRHVVNKASTSTSYPTSSVNPSVFGQPVTFTTTVTAGWPGSGTPTGTVTFMDGATTLGTGTTNGSGVATYTTSTIGVGNSHRIVATYAGDTNFTGSTSATLSQAINKADTRMAVTSSRNASTYGQSVTFTATVSPVAPGAGTATGTITFLDGGSPICVASALTGGVATCTTSSLSASNHTIATSYVGDGSFNGSTGSLTGNPQVVNKANATVTAVSFHKVYGSAYIPTGTEFTTSGLVNGDTITSVTLNSNGFLKTATAVAPGPTYPITPSAAAGTGLSNYTITYTDGTLTVDSAPLTVTANSFHKTYGNPYTPQGTEFTTSGLANGDTISSVTLTSPGFGSMATVATPGPTYAITPSAPVGTGIGNYAITYTAGALSVDTATLTLTPAGSKTKTYGQTFSAFTGQVTGLQNTDAVTVNYSSTGTPAAAGVGSYDIIVDTINFTSGEASNYNINKNTATGGLTVNKAAASVTPTAASKAYGVTDPAFSGTLSGFVTADNVTASYSRVAGETVAGSPYTISATLNPAAALANYDVTYNTAAFTINKATASVTPTAASKTYGVTDPALSGTLAGFIVGDNVTASYSRAAGETAAGGPYTISATLSPVGVLGNYNITYGTAAFTINKAAASVTPIAASKTYGTTDPALSGTVSGFLASDNVTANYSRAAGETVAGGPYTISATLSPVGVLGNYDITYGTAAFTINRANSAATLQTSASTVMLNNNFTLTAKVSSASGAPTGSVNFMDGTTSVGSGTLDNTGSATLTLSTLLAGDHSLTAVYAGDSNFNGVTSTALSEAVQDFRLAVNGSSGGSVFSATVLPGGVAAYQLQVAPTNGTTFFGPITLSLSGLPAGATYTITPSSIAAGSSSQTVTVQVQTLKPVAGLRTRGSGSPLFALGLLVPMFGIVQLRRLGAGRTKRVALVYLLLAVAMLGMSACGGGSGFLNQAPQTYTLQLNAASGALQHTTTLNLTIQ
jgi:Bacterial Ig-like domain (group 3)/MBG domain (YGX type)